MKHSNAFKAISSATLGAVLLAVMVQGAAAQQAKQTRGVTNVVLVHGAWADGSSFAKVIPLLEAQGLHVVAVQLPLTSLAEDVATVKRALALEEAPVLLVAHSYGGVVITQAGDDPKVAGLVYIAALAPPEGQSALDLVTAYPTPVLDELQGDAAAFLKISPKGIREDFAPDLTESEQTVLLATQGPTSFDVALSVPVSIAAWRNKPCWFVIASRDRVVSPTLQVIEAQQMNASSITLRSSHVPMLSQPLTVAAFIRRAARDAL